MRPTRIELEGFSAYRGRVIVDLGVVAGSDLPFFSLAGATGAGKSSLIDAMIFALYGRIPRLGAREVAPVISAGTDRARVRLDFEVDGTPYTAVRLASRTANGATIKEARLERGDDVLASGADKVTSAVEELLALGFEDFTRTVVLPQGDFARFLTATKAERQALLRGILGLEVYGRVRELATARQATATARAEAATGRLDALEVPNEEAVANARDRLLALEALTGAISEGERELTTLVEAAKTAQHETERIEATVQRLDRLEAPDDLESLGEMVSEARSAVSDTEEAQANAVEMVAEIEKLIAEAPTPESLTLARRGHEEMEEVTSRLDSIDPSPVRVALAEAEELLTVSKAHVAAIGARDTALREAHSAHTLGATLVLGEPCPVCLHPVEKLPQRERLPELESVQDELTAALSAVEADQRAVDGARANVTEVETTMANLMMRRVELASALEGLPDRAELARLEAVAADLSVRLSDAKKMAGEHEKLMVTARKRLEDLASREQAMDRLLKNALINVAELDPPVSESDDVVVQWKDLLAWKEIARERVSAASSGALEAALTARTRCEVAQRALADRLTALGLPVAEPYSAVVAAETERARQVVAQYERDLAESTVLKVEVESESAIANVAAALATHLRADGFERWMMAGALHNLVVGANDLLSQLSDGGYSLHSEEGTFTVIDHRNADERRSVSTLSGGETFLVSLALALSLAEALAGSGGARLDAIILDEGFGTLDDESLDTVATVLEGLAGQGLMVGVITHVKELAARAATRFEVTRGPKGSTVSELA